MRRVFMQFFLHIFLYSLALIGLIYVLFMYMNNMFSHLVSLIIAIIVALLLSLFISFLLSKIVTIPLRDMISVTRLITDEVDLSEYVTYRSKNEFGSLSYGLNRLIKGLRNILYNIRDHSRLFTNESE